MKLTRITGENSEYFSHLIPEGVMNDDELVHLGIIDDDGVPVSAGAVGVADSMARIEWLYTDPLRRAEGAGSMLMEEVIKLVSDMPLKGIVADFTEDDQYMDSFLANCDFLVGINDGLYQVPIIDLVYGEGMDQLSEDREDIVKFYACNEPGVIKKFINFTEAAGISPKGRRRIFPEYSVVRISDSGDIDGCLLISKTGRGDLAVEYMEAPSPADAAGLILKLYDILIKNDITEGNLILTDHHGSGISMVEALTKEDRSSYKETGLYHAVRLLEG